MQSFLELYIETNMGFIYCLNRDLILESISREYQHLSISISKISLKISIYMYNVDMYICIHHSIDSISRKLAKT